MSCCDGKVRVMLKLLTNSLDTERNVGFVYENGSNENGQSSKNVP